MKKTILSIAAVLLSAYSMAVVNYQVVPMPQSVQLDPSGKTALLAKGLAVSYPAEDPLMKRNAEFAQEYLGLVPTEAPKKKDKSPVILALGLQTENPDAYKITIDKRGIRIDAATPSGVFYGIQTLRKSVMNEDGDSILLPYATIEATPRFLYRGTMLDCARHFFPAEYVKHFIDILALHGVNKFHWHLTDDQGWRFEVKSMPELAKKGGYRPYTIMGHNVGLGSGMPIYDDTPEEGYYTQAELREIVHYAQERFITIIPEIDLPGHMVAALSVYPELGCTGGPYFVRPYWGVDPDVLCAGNPKTLEFIKGVLGELCEVFPSKYIHIGGDESPRARWEKCPKCQAKKKELGLEKEAQLQTYILKEVETFLASKGRELIGWDEILEGGLSEGATVMSWRGFNGGIEAARQHHRVIMTPTSFCYIDYYQLKDHGLQPDAIGGYLPLSKVYSVNPIPEELSEEEGKYIIGLQCNLWTEYVVSPQHADYMLLPRLAAMSENQWLQTSEKEEYDQFLLRLEGMEKIYAKLGFKYCPSFE